MCSWPAIKPATRRKPPPLSPAYRACCMPMRRNWPKGLLKTSRRRCWRSQPEYSHILFPATSAGKNVAPRVAALLDVAQVSDIIRVVSADTFERPIYAGNAIVTVQSGDR